MNLTWAVQCNLLNMERQDNVARLLGELGIDYVGVNVVPFSDALHFLFDEPTHANVIPYGSQSLIRGAATRGWKGLFFHPHLFRVEAWIEYRSDMLNQDPTVMTLAQAISWSANQQGRLHIRPCEDSKAFAGMTLKAREFHEWLRGIEQSDFASRMLDAGTMIATSYAQNIHMEWRWFVVGGRVIDGSTYGHASRKHETDQAVINEAQTFADKWLPHETCVMDLALTDDGLKVVEFNCLNGTGFYDHDVKKVLSAVTEYAQATIEAKS